MSRGRVLAVTSLNKIGPSLFDFYFDAIVNHAHRISPDRQRRRFTLGRAISDIERGTVQRANQSMGAQPAIFQFRSRVRALIFDSEEIFLHVADQDIPVCDPDRQNGSMRYAGNICRVYISVVSQRA